MRPNSLPAQSIPSNWNVFVDAGCSFPTDYYRPLTNQTVSGFDIKQWGGEKRNRRRRPRRHRKRRCAQGQCLRRIFSGRRWSRFEEAASSSFTGMRATKITRPNFLPRYSQDLSWKVQAAINQNRPPFPEGKASYDVHVLLLTNTSARTFIGLYSDPTYKNLFGRLDRLKCDLSNDGVLAAKS